jgi:hypothetical protein
MDANKGSKIGDFASAGVHCITGILYKIKSERQQ